MTWHSTLSWLSIVSNLKMESQTNLNTLTVENDLYLFVKTPSLFSSSLRYLIYFSTLIQYDIYTTMLFWFFAHKKVITIIIKYHLLVKLISICAHFFFFFMIFFWDGVRLYQIVFLLSKNQSINYQMSFYYLLGFLKPDQYYSQYPECIHNCIWKTLGDVLSG